jgi:hypothetical protein
VAREQHVARDIVFVMSPAQTFEMKKTLFKPFFVKAEIDLRSSFEKL